MKNRTRRRGGHDLYVRPFPDVDGAKWQISTPGGRKPQWAPDGRSVFYVAGTRIMRVPIRGGPPLSWETAQIVVEAAPYLSGLDNAREYAVAPGGDRFLMIKRGDAATRSGPDIIVVEHWLDELRRLVPLR